MRELILVRHGQSHYNVGLTTHLDSELTPEGVRQVRETGKFLRRHLNHLHEFVGRCSPYLRCLQTARILSQETGVEFWIEDGPREIMVSYDSCHVPHRSLDFPEFVWDRYRRKSADCAFIREDDEKFNKRIGEYYEYLEKNHNKVLVVSHGTPTTALHEMSLGKYKGPGIEKGTYVDNSSISYTRHGELVWYNKVVYGEEAVQGQALDGLGDPGVEV